MAASSGADSDRVLEVMLASPAEAAAWPAAPAKASTSPPRSRRAVRDRRHGSYNHEYVVRPAPGMPSTTEFCRPSAPVRQSVESALSTLADESARTSAMQMQLLLLGAGAAAETRVRNDELLARNRELARGQERLEAENAAMRELKSRCIVLSQENARLHARVSEADQLRARVAELDGVAARLRAEAEVRGRGERRDEELARRCEGLEEQLQAAKTDAAAAAAKAGAELTVAREEVGRPQTFHQPSIDLPSTTHRPSIDHPSNFHPKSLPSRPLFPGNPPLRADDGEPDPRS